jgi:hypothetical protein
VGKAAALAYACCPGGHSRSHVAVGAGTHAGESDGHQGIRQDQPAAACTKCAFVCVTSLHALWEMYTPTAT